MSILPAIIRTVATRFHYPNEIPSPSFLSFFIFYLYLGVLVECRCDVEYINSWGREMKTKKNGL